MNANALAGLRDTFGVTVLRVDIQNPVVMPGVRPKGLKSGYLKQPQDLSPVMNKSAESLIIGSALLIVALMVAGMMFWESTREIDNENE